MVINITPKPLLFNRITILIMVIIIIQLYQKYDLINHKVDLILHL